MSESETRRDRRVPKARIQAAFRDLVCSALALWLDYRKSSDMRTMPSIERIEEMAKKLNGAWDSLAKQRNFNVRSTRGTNVTEEYRLALGLVPAFEELFKTAGDEDVSLQEVEEIFRSQQMPPLGPAGRDEVKRILRLPRNKTARLALAGVPFGCSWHTLKNVEMAVRATERERAAPQPPDRLVVRRKRPEKRALLALFLRRALRNSNEVTKETVSHWRRAQQRKLAAERGSE